MKFVKYAQYVGTTTGPEGYLRRWTAPREKFIHRTRKISRISKSLVERLIDFTITISAPDGVTLKEEAHALPCTTTGLYNAVPTDLLRVVSACGLGIDLFGVRIFSLVPGLGRLPTRTHLPTAFRRSVLLVDTMVSPFSAILPSGKSFEDVDGTHHRGRLRVCASLGSWWQDCRLSQE